MVLSMPRINLLSVRPDQTLLPSNSTVGITSCLCEPCVGGWRLRLVGRIRVLSVIIERRLSVATLGILEGYASVWIDGILREGRLGWERDLGLVRGSGGLWGSGRTRRTLSSVIHRGGVFQRESSSVHARSLREGSLRARLKVRKGVAVAVCAVHGLWMRRNLGGRNSQNKIIIVPDKSSKLTDKS